MKWRDRSKWRVQAFLLPEITGSVEAPYAPIIVTGERNADSTADRLLRDFSPGMVRVETERLPDA